MQKEYVWVAPGISPEVLSEELKRHNLGDLGLKQALLEWTTDRVPASGVIPASVFDTPKRLVTFDMDSTLIQNEVIDEIARESGVYAEIAALTERSMRGELPFEESLRLRCSKLKGLTQSHLENILKRLRLSGGAKELLVALRAQNVRSALVSGGFSFAALQVKAELGLDYVFSNHLEMKDGQLTGEVLLPIIGAATKAQVLTQLMRENGLIKEQTIAVGDGANDIPMLERAGIGIAFNGKPRLKEVADVWIKGPSLAPVESFIGQSKDSVRFWVNEEQKVT